MFETLRKLLLFGLGAAAVSADKIREVVDDLVKRGEITAEEGRKMYEELMCRTEEERRKLNERIRAQIRDTLKEIGVADRTQIAALETRIAALEQKIETMSAAPPRPGKTER